LVAARRIVVNSWRKARVKPEQLLVVPQCWATIDYHEVATPQIGGAVSFLVAHSGVGHGLVLWFDSILTTGVRMSNAPASPELIYGSGFFPWTTPVALDAGDQVRVEFRATLVGADYIWCWDTLVLPKESHGPCKANFHQSSFFAVPLSKAKLKLRADDFVPALTDEGRADRLILDLMENGQGLGGIAERLAAAFPQRFADTQQALDHVADLAQKYCCRKADAGDTFRALK